MSLTQVLVVWGCLQFPILGAALMCKRAAEDVISKWFSLNLTVVYLAVALVVTRAAIVNWDAFT